MMLECLTYTLKGAIYHHINDIVLFSKAVAGFDVK